jgi:hypothetical protein
VSAPEQVERGDRGPFVAKLIGSLSDLGYLTAGGPPVFGGKTYSAVCRFQQHNGLIASGVATPETWAALERELTRRPNAPSGPGIGRGLGGGEAPAPRRREMALVRGIRVFAVGLAFLAATFGVLFLMSLSRPEHFGSLGMWLPLVFAASVFIGAFLIGQWGTAIAARPLSDRMRALGTASPSLTTLTDAAEEEDPEPVRVGTVLAAPGEA